MARTLLIALALGLALAAPAAAESPCQGKAWALVIGIGDYQGRLSRLAGAPEDARRVGAALAQQGFAVTTLVDGQAKLARIKTELSDLISRTRPEDRVLVYFAGHGVTVGGDAPQGYLAPADFDPQHAVVRGLAMRELVDLLKAMPARKRLFLADACYSGLALPGTRRIVRSEVHPSHCPNADTLSVTAAIVAGRKDQVAHETPVGGVFTQVLLDVLKGRTAADFDQDGWIDQRMLGLYLGNEVPRRVKSEWGVEQNPQDGQIGDGRFLLQVKGPTEGRQRGPVAVGVPEALWAAADEPAPTPDFQYPVTVGFGIAALAGVALGVTFWQLVESANEAADAADNHDDFTAAKGDADLFYTLQVASYAVGGAAAIGAVAAFLIERTPREPQALRWQVGPGYVGLGGRF